MNRRPWTPAEIEQLIERYPHERTAAIAADLGRSEKQCFSKAKALGLAKTAAYLASPDACRLRRGDDIGAEYRFKPGLTPWNKGMKGLSYEGQKATQFKPGILNGRAAQQVKQVGDYRICDGVLQQKTSTTPGPNNLRWTPVHRLLWVAANGPVPAGHLVRFRPGRHTTVLDEITLDRLELVSYADNMRRNTLHRYPPEIVKTMQLRGALNRKINARSKHHEHDE